MEKLGEERATKTNLVRIAEVAQELLFAAVRHPDVTDEVLDKMRERLSPLVDCALSEMSGSIGRRDPETGEEVWPEYPFC